jgi:hypothetical protein
MAGWEDTSQAIAPPEDWVALLLVTTLLAMVVVEFGEQYIPPPDMELLPETVLFLTRVKSPQKIPPPNPKWALFPVTVFFSTFE